MALADRIAIEKERLNKLRKISLIKEVKNIISPEIKQVGEKLDKVSSSLEQSASLTVSQLEEIKQLSKNDIKEQIEELSTKLSTLGEVVEGLENTDLEPLKKSIADLSTTIKKKDFRGEKGDTFTFDDLTTAQIDLLIEELLKVIPRPKDGADGVKGEKGEKGDAGKDGRDGSPDTALEIRDKLQSLKKNDRLDISAIKGLTNAIASMYEQRSPTGGADDSKFKLRDEIMSPKGNWTLSMDNNAITDISSATYQNDYVPTGNEPIGTSYWDRANRTFSDVLEDGVVGQRYKEAFIDGQNDTGSTITDGTPVEYAGSIGNSGNFRIAPAIVTKTKPPFYFIGIATHEILDGNIGKITTRGKVRGIQTDGANYGETWNDSDIIYISRTTAGYLTKTPPPAPYPAIPVALVISAHPTNGTLEIRPSFPQRLSELVDVNGTPFDTTGQFPVWDNANEYFDANYLDPNYFDSTGTPLTVSDAMDKIIHAWNGVALQNFDFSIASNGTTITGSLEATGGGDISYWYSGHKRTLDCTPACTVTLTPGTDTIPQLGHVYIDAATNTLTYKTSSYLTDWPSTEHVPISIVILRSAATTQTDGALGNQNINNRPENESSNNRGWIQIAGNKMRSFGSDWQTGVIPTISIISASSPDDVYLSTTSGIVNQFNPQTFPAFDMATGSDIHVVNDSAAPYRTTMNLNTELTDANGASLSGRYFWLTYWGVINKSGQMSHLMLNLPTGSYTVLANAQADINATKVRTKPVIFGNTGFLIAETLFQHNAAGGGAWTEIETNVLLGTDTAGNGGGSIVSPITSFSDGQFDVYNATDPTKVIELDASGITPNNTRTLIMPDADAKPLTSVQNTDLTDGGDSTLHYHSNDRVLTNQTGGNWKVIYTNGSGATTELPLGAANTVLTSNGAAVAPTFETPSGGGGGAVDLITSGTITTNVTEIDMAISTPTDYKYYKVFASLISNGTATSQQSIAVFLQGNGSGEALRSCNEGSVFGGYQTLENTQELSYMRYMANMAGAVSSLPSLELTVPTKSYYLNTISTVDYYYWGLHYLGGAQYGTADDYNAEYGYLSCYSDYHDGESYIQLIRLEPVLATFFTSGYYFLYGFK